MALQLTINGESVRVEAETIFDLLAERGIEAGAKGLAVALNGALAPKPAWSTIRFAEADVIEIVKPFAGG